MFIDMKNLQPHIDKCQYEEQNGSVNSFQAVDAKNPQPSCCARPDGHVAVGDVEAQHLARVFKALGDPARVKLLSLIVASARGEMCACDMTEPVGLSQPTVSHHLKQLVEAGLVTREQRGRWAYYSPVASVLTAATSTLTA
jgi:ArsR family transcriptional regulator